MKINYMAVNNFRGISGDLESNRIDFQNTNTLFIIGQNNSGKSTFLEAYSFFHSDNTPTKSDFFHQDYSNEISFEIEVEIDSFDRERIEEKAKKQKDSYKEYVSEENFIRLKKTWTQESGKLSAKNRTWHPTREEWIDIGYASVGLHSVFQSCLPKPIIIKAMPSETEAKEELNKILKAVAESRLKEKDLAELNAAKEKINELQGKMYDSLALQNYEESINQYFSKLFPDIKINLDDEKSKMAWTEAKLGRNFDLSFSQLNTDGEIQSDIPSGISSIGHGTIRSAIFTLLLLRDIAEGFTRTSGRKDYMVLFEEPELFLYPKITRELKNLIYTVSEDDLPYQVLCASHSPNMIDLSKPKSSIIRLEKTTEGTIVHQINDEFLKSAKDVKTDIELRNEMYEVLRFNPFICESFYSDEVLLVEGPTEEILARAYLQEVAPRKDLFVLNCGSVTNIPFYQKVFAQFGISYNVICDTDDSEIVECDDFQNPSFAKGIQKSISEQFHKDMESGNKGVFRVHDETFEPAHRSEKIPERLRYGSVHKLGKPYSANEYWKNVIRPNIDKSEIETLPYIRFLKEICTR